MKGSGANHYPRAPAPAPGADGIKYPILKKCPNIVFENLAHIYNQCLNIGYFPKKWQEATGTMIPKPEKYQSSR